MNKFYSKDLIVLLKEQLDNGKTVSFTPKGNSMKPMLDGKNDIVFLKKPQSKLHLNDVALYYRRETDTYSIHRVVDFGKNNTYTMLGDNNIQREYNISHNDVLGVITSFYHKNKHISVDTSLRYKLYCEVLFYFRPLRWLYLKAKIKLSSFFGDKNEH